MQIVGEGIQEAFTESLQDQQNLHRLETLSSSYLLPQSLELPWSFSQLGICHALCEPDSLDHCILLTCSSGSTYHLLWSSTTQLTGSSPTLSPTSYGWEDRSIQAYRETNAKWTFSLSYVWCTRFHNSDCKEAFLIHLLMVPYESPHNTLRMSPFLNLNAKFSWSFNFKYFITLLVTSNIF